MALLNGIAEARSRRDEKHRIVLDFLKHEVATTRPIVELLLDCQRQSALKTLKGMERAGLVFSHKFRTEITELTIWGLTVHGAALAHAPGEDYPYFEPGRIGENTLAHDLWVQRLRVKAVRAGWKNWINEKQIKRDVGAAAMSNNGKTAWRRIPDAVAQTPAGETVAVEVERTVKSPKRYSDIMVTYLQMITARTVQRVHYVCVTPSVRDRLAAIFSKISTVPVDGTHVKIEDKHRAKFLFYTVDDWLSDAKTKEQTS